MISLVDSPYIVKNTKNNKTYAIIDSYDFPQLIINQKSLNIKLFVNNNDETHKLFSSRYYILCGGMQIYTGIYEATITNILPINSVPFGLLKNHCLAFIFEVFDTENIKFELTIDEDK